MPIPAKKYNKYEADAKTLNKIPLADQTIKRITLYLKSDKRVSLISVLRQNSYLFHSRKKDAELASFKKVPERL